MIISNNYVLNISNDKIDYNSIYNPIILKKNGAIVSFVGSIKKFTHKNVEKIYYSIFLDLAYAILIKKLDYLTSEYNCNIYLYQYYGYLNVGEINVAIIVSSSNRKLSFDICSLLLEYLKTKVPIWKKEFYVDNSVKWINSV